MIRPLPVIALGALLCGAPLIAATCESLASLTLPDATITSAQSVAAGAFSVPASGRGGGRGGDPNAAFKELPAFCRVSVTLKPSADSDIKMEIWLPAAGWNGKFEGVGNGGLAGTISYNSMAPGLQRGFATASRYWAQFD